MSKARDRASAAVEQKVLISNYTATNAAAYERLMGRWSRVLAEDFIAFAGLEAGDRVLDLGCGTGSLAQALAASPLPAAIFGIDAAEPYVVYAAERNTDRRVTFAVGDAATLDLPAHSFDRCYSLLVLNFVPAPDKAIAEMLRVVRPGGTIAAVVWDFTGGLVYQRIFWDTAAALDPTAVAARARHYASALTWPGELEAAFAAAGAVEIATRSLAIRMAYDNFADYWQPIANAQGPIGDYVKSLSDDRLAQLARAVEAAYLCGRPDGPRSLAATAWSVKDKIYSL